MIGENDRLALCLRFRRCLVRVERANETAALFDVGGPAYISGCASRASRPHSTFPFMFHSNLFLSFFFYFYFFLSMWAKHCAITIREWSVSYLTHGLLWCPLPLIDFSSLQWNIKVSSHAPQSVSWVIQLSLNYYFSLYQGRAYSLKSIKCKRYIFIVIYLLLLPLHLIRVRAPAYVLAYVRETERQNMWQCDVHMCAPLCAIHQFEWVCVHECVWASLPASQHACARPLRHVGKHELPELNPCPLNSYWSRSRGREIKFHLLGFMWARMLACSPPFRLSTPYKEERRKWGKRIGWSLGNLLEEMDEEGKEEWPSSWLLNYTSCWTWDWTCLHVSVLESVCKSAKVNVFLIINIIVNVPEEFSNDT